MERNKLLVLFKLFLFIRNCLTFSVLFFFLYIIFHYLFVINFLFIIKILPLTFFILFIVYYIIFRHISKKIIRNNNLQSINYEESIIINIKLREDESKSN